MTHSTNQTESGRDIQYTGTNDVDTLTVNNVLDSISVVQAEYRHTCLYISIVNYRACLK